MKPFSKCFGVLAICLLFLFGCQSEKHPNNIRQSPSSASKTQKKKRALRRSPTKIRKLDARDPRVIRGKYENKRYGISFRIPRGGDITERSPKFLVKVSQSGQKIFWIEHVRTTRPVSYKREVGKIMQEIKGPYVRPEEVVLSPIEIGRVKAYEVFFNRKASRRISYFYEGTSKASLQI